MKRPLVYYALAMYMASFTLIFLNFNILFGIIIAGLFLGLIFYTQDFQSFVLVTCFFLIGCFSFYIYFTPKISDEKAVFRIIENKYGYCSGSYKGRKVNIKGDVYKLKSGNKIVASGNFKNIKDYSKGIIGEYKVQEYKKCKIDLLERLYIVKEELYNKYSKVLGDKKAAVVMACCYGDTRYLKFNTKDEINKLGICHIISVSGFHIALIYRVIESVLGVKLALIASFIYMMFTGGKAATIRAYIMILILKLSKSVYKNYDSLSALSLAAIILLLIKPYYPMDIGFMLSFLATLGIILYNKKIKRILYRLPTKINESFSITLSAQVFSMPYAMCTIKNISMFFIPGNLILIPLYSLVILIGNIGLLTYKINFLFKIITSLLYSITTAIEGGTYLILKVTPSVMQYNCFYGIAMISMFITYIFLKHDYDRAIYFPIVIFCFVIMYNVL